MLGEEEKQTDKRMNSGKKGKKKKDKGKERRKGLRQLKKRKAMIYHWEGEVE